MIDSLTALSPIQLVGIAVAIVATIVASLTVWYKNKAESDIDDEIADLVSGGLDAGDLAALEDEYDLDEEALDAIERRQQDSIQLDPPDVSGSILATLKVWRHRAKQERLARKGYVKWYKIGSKLSRPRWIKPTKDGSGEWKFYDSDDNYWYYFPEDGMVTDAMTGAYVAIHHRGESTPINLRDPIMPAIDADRLREVIQLEVESDAPGFFDKLDLDSGQILAGGIALMLILAALAQLLGGGF